MTAPLAMITVRTACELCGRPTLITHDDPRLVGSHPLFDVDLFARVVNHVIDVDRGPCGWHAYAFHPADVDALPA